MGSEEEEETKALKYHLHKHSSGEKSEGNYSVTLGSPISN